MEPGVMVGKAMGDKIMGDKVMGGEKKDVALSSVLASAAMTVMKLTVGLMTGSLGILSEAAHSLLDLGAASLTWFAVRVSDKPADAEHPYGHGKIENVSALIETGLLFLTSAWIIKEAVGRLLSDTVEVETTWYGVAVIVISIAIDYTRSRALLKVARQTGSQALEADACIFRRTSGVPPSSFLAWVSSPPAGRRAMPSPPSASRDSSCWRAI